jgi:drug/metabolite transporter (DMT)-like permease
MAATMGIVFALTTMFCWGISDILAKKAIDKIGHVSALFINQAVSLSVLLVIASLFCTLPVFSLHLVFMVVVTGAVGITGFFYAYKGFQKGNISVVSPIAASGAVITTLLACLIFKETLTLIQVAGIAIVFVGIFLSSTNLSNFKRSFTQGKSNGVPEALISMFTWGLYFILMKPLVGLGGPIVALAFLRSFGVFTIFSMTRLTGKEISFPSRQIFLFLVVASLLDAFAFTMYNYGVTTDFISIITPIASTYPAVTVTLAYFVLKEKIVVNQVVGVVAILFGIALISLI